MKPHQDKLISYGGPISYSPGGPRRRGLWRVDYYEKNCIKSQWFKTKRAAADRFSVLFLKGKEPEMWKEST